MTEEEIKRDMLLKRRLLMAAFNNNLGLLKEAVSIGASVNDALDSMGWSALHFFTSYGNLEAMEFLVDQGADSHCKAKDGTMPCHYAIKSGNLECVKFLLLKGFDFEMDRNGEWALNECKAINKSEVVEYVQAFMANKALTCSIDAIEIDYGVAF